MALGYTAAYRRHSYRNIGEILRSLARIFKGAFGVSAVTGGFSGALMRRPLRWG
jgi:Na+/alanine symporter